MTRFGDPLVPRSSEQISDVVSVAVSNLSRETYCDGGVSHGRTGLFNGTALGSVGSRYLSSLRVCQARSSSSAKVAARAAASAASAASAAKEAAEEAAEAARADLIALAEQATQI